MKRLTCDVTVIGAGPAGSVLATRLTQLGFDVCVIERSRFPRLHLGESLSPGVIPMLASIGSATVIEQAGFPHVTRVRTNWEGQVRVRVDPLEQGLLIDRGVFDAALLSRLAAMGARVLQPAHLVSHAQHEEGWSLRVICDSEEVDISCAFVADATGRSMRMGGDRRSTGVRTVAVYGYWVGAALPSAPRIEATPSGWCWGVPIPDGSYNTLVFLDADQVNADGRMLDDRMRDVLAGTRLGEDVRHAELRGRARAADATPYVNERCVSARHIAVGDAALAIDPLSSSGVQKAVQSALSGAIVVNTLLRKPDLAEAAIQFHRDSIARASERHCAWAAQHYAVPAARFDTPFWSARAATAAAERDAVPLADDVPLQLSIMAQLEEQPCLGSYFVEQRPALIGPDLDGPVAYLGGHELAPLLQQVRCGMTIRDLAAAWLPRVAMSDGLSIARWLSSHGVLEPMDRAMIGA